MDLLKKIQNSDNEEKKRWLIILSGIAMVIIVIMWLSYMNSVIFKNPNEMETQEIKTDFWLTLKTGVSVTTDNIINGIKGLIRKQSN